MRSSYTGLLLGLLFAIMLDYLLIVVNFQSWLDSVILVSALPAALEQYLMERNAEIALARRAIGSDSQRPFAIVIVGGLIAALSSPVFTKVSQNPFGVPLSPPDSKHGSLAAHMACFQLGPLWRDVLVQPKKIVRVIV
jgi:hypothetical protein